MALPSSDDTVSLFLAGWWTNRWAVNWITTPRWLIRTLWLLELDAALLSSKIALIPVAIVGLVGMRRVRWSGNIIDIGAIVR